MSKSTYFTGQPLYAQLLKLADKQKIDNISKEGSHDHYVKKLNGYSHFVILLYGVLMCHDSLRERVVVMLKKLTLSNGSFIAMDRVYIDYRVFEEFSQDGVFYVTKMKKNQRFKQLDSCYMVNEKGLAVLNDSTIEFEKDEIIHTSRRI